MKPTPQISHDQNASQSFPLSDYNFQATVEAPASSSAVLPATKSSAFHKLSSELFAAKTTGDYFAELLSFVMIGGIAAWPVISMLHAITRMVRNY
jgi:hypothetical protein